eukprot:6111482-Pyramimonas_sp.AAC.1
MEDTTQCNLPPWGNWVDCWTSGDWNAGWYCGNCHAHIFDAAPSVINRILARDAPSMYPVSPAARTSKKRKEDA